ncbi:hypothetical protein KIKIMORA_00320 [Brevundimonas phage vB_BpoS-Kikimora]|uniref:Uncharacterized protein n=2 Tax=Kikimoravirus TaxID=3425051 RepID=A0A9E7SQG0_9CAUD|nr:hypothetical protein KIKIMORA_00320 [Brevundimonas phage vB_BpoS-Kikimora]UTC28068.1 hypothetical protein GURKE_00360 [Brevundimonas phage vB_BpoS-Gurke]
MAGVIYTLPDGDDGPIAYTTKAKAIAEARDWANYAGIEVEVERCVLADLPRRELAVALITGRGWCKEMKVVFTAKPRGEA